LSCVKVRFFGKQDSHLRGSDLMICHCIADFLCEEVAYFVR
jgi:hypothetical protein